MTTAAGLLTAVPAVPAAAERLPHAPADARPVTPEVRELRIPAVASAEAQPVPSARAHPDAQADQPVVADTGRRSTAPFDMLAVTWAPSGDAHADAAEHDHAQEPVVEARVRSDGTWTAWQRLYVEIDGPDSGSARLGTTPLWVGDADGAQARVMAEDGAPRDLELVLIDAGESPADDDLAAAGTSTGSATASDAVYTTDTAAFSTSTATATASTTNASATATTTAGASGPSRPAIVSRRGWGADESLRSRCDAGRYTRTVKVAFVHHTAGTNSYTRSESPRIVRGVYAYHTKSRGWCDIGYNFLVDRYGTIFEGRFGGVAKPVMGAHTGGYNNDSMGVSLMGTFESARPTAAMMDAAVRIIAWKLAQNYRNPVGRATINGKRFNVIAGHRDAKATACPGQQVYDRLPWVRNQVDALIPPYSSPIFRKWQALGGESGFVRSPFRGEHGIAGGLRALFGGADITWKSGLGAHEVHGKVRQRWRGLGSASGRLGFPTSDERAGALDGVRLNVFTGGRIYHSPRTGSHPIWGAFLRWYRNHGAEKSRLGLPRSGEYAVAGGVAQRFQRGRMYHSDRTGGHPVWGAMLRRYDALGAHRSRLRLPRSGEYAVTGGLRQAFQGGHMYWSQGTGAHPVWGAIRKRYHGLGGPGSRMGLPLSGEYAVRGGRGQTFQRGSRMYWSSGTGAHPVWGAIGRRYLGLGGPGSRLGLPTRGEYAVSGGIAQQFQGGRIRWDRRTDTTLVTYT